MDLLLELLTVLLLRLRCVPHHVHKGEREVHVHDNVRSAAALAAAPAAVLAAVPWIHIIIYYEPNLLSRQERVI